MALPLAKIEGRLGLYTIQHRARGFPNADRIPLQSESEGCTNRTRSREQLSVLAGRIRRVFIGREEQAIFVAHKVLHCFGELGVIDVHVKAADDSDDVRIVFKCVNVE